MNEWVECPGCGTRIALPPPVGPRRSDAPRTIVRCGECRTRFRLVHGLGDPDAEQKHRLGADTPGGIGTI